MTSEFLTLKEKINNGVMLAAKRLIAAAAKADLDLVVSKDGKAKHIKARDLK